MYLSHWSLLIVFVIANFASALVVAETNYDPRWSGQQPKQTIRLKETSGEGLVRAVAQLKPGDRLEIPAGTYSVERMWDIAVSGTAEAPIWITAQKDATVVITRPDGKQNVVNVGVQSPVSYLCIAGLELTGGSHGLRLGQCRNVWIDRCHIHHTADVCLSANSASTQHLYLTRNHLHDGSGHGEGMYLGSHDGKLTMSESVIALNHIHDCGGSQGDGIEVKQGSWGNLIAENHVHDTHYPCITVYGTAGKPVNIIERNLCYRSADHAMQVQGEAIVRNNVLISAKGSGFASTDHQGRTLNLQVIHNTIINSGHAFSGGSWNGREGMVLANNVLISKEANAFHFANGFEGVIIQGNVVSGQGNKHNSALARGLTDFVAVTWDAQSHDATPVVDAPFHHASAKYLLPTDFQAKARSEAVCGAVVR